MGEKFYIDDNDLDIIESKQINSIEKLKEDIEEAKQMKLLALKNKYVKKLYNPSVNSLYPDDEICVDINSEKAKKVLTLEKEINELTRNYNELIQDYIYTLK